MVYVQSAIAQGDVSHACSIARRHLSFRAATPSEEVEKNALFDQYFATNICAPKGEISPMYHPPIGPKDEAWELSVNGKYKGTIVKRKDVGLAM